MANESELFDLIVAADRIGSLVDAALNLDFPLPRRIRALKDLAKAVEGSDALFDEAQRQQVARRLARYAERPDLDDALANALSHAVSACSGAQARGLQEEEYVLPGGQLRIRLREQSLGDGLGMRLWAGAFTLVRELIEFPEIVRDRFVLELGSGTGFCGIVARLLGAAHVTLTDNEPAVLENLRKCVEMNAEPISSSSSDAGVVSPLGQRPWRMGGMEVRRLEWAEWGGDDGAGYQLGHVMPTLPCEEGPGQTAPAMPPGIRFDTIIATDVLYDEAAATVFPRAVAARLAPGGRCLVGGPVRDTKTHDKFLRSCVESELRYAQRQVSDAMPEVYAGVLMRKKEYECYVLVYVERRDAPAAQWWRGDLPWVDG